MMKQKNDGERRNPKKEKNLFARIKNKKKKKQKKKKNLFARKKKKKKKKKQISLVDRSRFLDTFFTYHRLFQPANNAIYAGHGGGIVAKRQGFHVGRDFRAAITWKGVVYNGSRKSTGLPLFFRKKRILSKHRTPPSLPSFLPSFVFQHRNPGGWTLFLYLSLSLLSLGGEK